MARFLGVEIPGNKRGEIGLTYIYGIGRSLAKRILTLSKVDKDKQVSSWTDAEMQKMRGVINDNHKVEGALRSEVRLHKKRLVDIGCYRGRRSERGLPVRGQRTNSNARTNKGKRKTVAGKKKVAR